MTSVRCWRLRAHRFPLRCRSPPIIIIFIIIVIIAMSIMVIIVTAISSTSTSRGETKKSLGRVHLPKELEDDLWLWKQECPDSQRAAFIFRYAKGRFMDTGNYRSRVLEAFMRWGSSH
jgi:hypothetical protein